METVEQFVCDTDQGAARLAGLVAEALRVEEKAAEADGKGLTAEAVLHHKRASSKFAEAAAMCPEGSDKQNLSDHAQDIATRVVYLQSLGGAAASLPLEDHVGELQVALDLSMAPSPSQDVAELVAGVGIDGKSAPLTEDSCRLVLALRNAQELRVYALRLITEDWRRLGEGGAASLESFVQEVCSKPPEAPSGSSLAHLKQELRSLPGVDLNLDADRLQLGVAMEKEAKELEEEGKAADALKAYERAVAVFKLVEKFDQRSKNPKIKEMVGKRIEDLEVRLTALKLAP